MLVQFFCSKVILQSIVSMSLFEFVIIQIVSNGKYKSTLHRAVMSDTSMRMSIVSIVAPSPDAVVVPAPQLVSGESPAAFQGMKYASLWSTNRATS